MKYVFLLSKEDIKLAKEEALSLLDVRRSRLVHNLLFLDLDNIELSNRLAYTRKVYQFLFETNKKDLIKKIKDFDWESVYKRDFSVRVHKLEEDSGNIPKERDLAAYIWRKLKKPKVNLSNPKTRVVFLIGKNKVYALKLVIALTHTFESRKAHKRPKLHPSAMNPKLARCIVNLTGARKEVMDPFCGAGGILIEAGLMGIKPIGCDLYKEMVDRAKINLDYYKIKGYKLVNQDALNIKRKYDYVVTDLPYGLNTSIWVKTNNKNKKISLKQTDNNQRIKNLEDFYLKFLKNLRKIMGKKGVVISPHYVDYRKLVKKAGFTLEKEFSQYIHGSLTRKILVLS
ncbi:MAG: DNA methyltransferase [Nanoarchaeota archaeon]|nr:DNA methyltransferase [Nanoarchaeota archaeon]